MQRPQKFLIPYRPWDWNIFPYLSGQILATKPPTSTSKNGGLGSGNPSKIPENSGLGIIVWPSQWPTFKLLGITYLIGKIKFKLFFQGPLAKWGIIVICPDLCFLCCVMTWLISCVFVRLHGQSPGGEEGHGRYGRVFQHRFRLGFSVFASIGRAKSLSSSRSSLKWLKNGRFRSRSEPRRAFFAAQVCYWKAKDETGWNSDSRKCRSWKDLWTWTLLSAWWMYK